MSDKNDMRRDFEALMHVAGKGRANAEMFEVDANGDYVLPTIYATFYGWQAATERATALERERCAKVLDALMTSRRRMNSSQKPDCEYVAAIRQGGAG